jgi:hypothetical protein
MGRRTAVLGLLLALVTACAHPAREPDTQSGAPTVDVTGSWAGTWVSEDPQFSGQCRFDLKQSDAHVTGVLLMMGVVPVQPSGYIDGVVTKDQFSFSKGPVSAALKVEGNTMRGPILGFPSPTTVVLYRVGP